MRNTLARSLVSLSLMAAVGLGVGCATDAGLSEEEQLDADLTSNTALSRKLEFAGVVYVDTTASDSTILATVRKQTQSAFGALREANVGVNSRELKDVDTSTFVKSTVSVVDTSATTPTTKTMTRVTYRYTDSALVPKTMARRSALSLGVLNGNYQVQSSRILKECTSNDAHAQEFVSSIWYVFNPSLSTCKTAMGAEAKTISADRGKLTDKNAVTASEVNRLYIPVTMRLTPNTTGTGLTYPEYDRLWAGGVQKGKVVIGMVSGLMADWAAGETHATIDDDGYAMWFEGMREIFKTRPGFKLTKIEPAEDLTTFTVGTTKVTGQSFDSIMKWELDSTGFPTTITTAQRRDLRIAASNKLLKHWLTFEEPVKVKIGTGAEQTVTIVLNTYFGAETDSTPHKRAIKTSDIFVYNGHSYIGYGPLDPSRFSASDFRASYQILVVNGCVSYNHYEKDYFPLKTGGTRNMELITNGLESWVNGSGPAMGRLVSSLIDGKQNSYSAVLKAAEFTGYGYPWGQDALRVVDGEVDNYYKPEKTPIVVSN